MYLFIVARLKQKIKGFSLVFLDFFIIYISFKVAKSGCGYPEIHKYYTTDPTQMQDLAEKFGCISDRRVV